MDPPSVEQQRDTTTEIMVDTNDQVPVEGLPLDKKLEALKKHNYFDNFNEGRYIDAQDTVNTWCLGQIVEVDQRIIKVHYDGWSSKWDMVSDGISSLSNSLDCQD